MNYQLSKEVRTHAQQRKAYNALTEKTFGFSFESWYNDGYWTNAHLPYTLFDGEKAVSNVSVNRMELLFRGKIYNCIQLGTVMTDEAYRGRGLSRFLFDEVRKDWEGNCDAMFLFANKSVLDFYPKLGFHKEIQYRFELKTDQAFGTGKKLDMDGAGSRKLFRRYYEKTNPFSKLQAVNNFELQMFYCTSFMKDSVWYLAKQDAVIVAEQEGDAFVCYDIFCGKDRELRELLFAAAPAGTKVIRLAFTPIDCSGLEVMPMDDEDDTLFVFGSAGGRKERLLFPQISHT